MPRDGIGVDNSQLAILYRSRSLQAQRVGHPSSDREYLTVAVVQTQTRASVLQTLPK